MHHCFLWIIALRSNRIPRPKGISPSIVSPALSEPVHSLCVNIMAHTPHHIFHTAESLDHSLVIYVNDFSAVSSEDTKCLKTIAKLPTPIVCNLTYSPNGVVTSTYQQVYHPQAYSNHLDKDLGVFRVSPTGFWVFLDVHSALPTPSPPKTSLPHLRSSIMYPVWHLHLKLGKNIMCHQVYTKRLPLELPAYS